MKKRATGEVEKPVQTDIIGELMEKNNVEIPRLSLKPKTVSGQDEEEDEHMISEEYPEDINEDDNYKKRSHPAEEHTGKRQKVNLISQTIDPFLQNIVYNGCGIVQPHFENLSLNIYPEMEELLKTHILNPLRNPEFFLFAPSVSKAIPAPQLKMSMPLSHVLLCYGASSTGKASFLRKWTNQHSIACVEIANIGHFTAEDKPFPEKTTAVVYLLRDMGRQLSREDSHFYRAFVEAVIRAQEARTPTWFVLVQEEQPNQLPTGIQQLINHSLWVEPPNQKHCEEIWIFSMSLYGNNQTLLDTDLKALHDASKYYTAGQIVKFVQTQMSQYLGSLELSIIGSTDPIRLSVARLLEAMVYVGGDRRMLNTSPESNYKSYSHAYAERTKPLVAKRPGMQPANISSF